jgi:crotonobetainyl-CoA:carnitine CoA-transferase CaiB-like acyl-CoA transferase
MLRLMLRFVPCSPAPSSAHLIAGPFCGKTLGELGADVIKIEAPADPGQPGSSGGDPLRNWPLIKEGTSVWRQVQSRHKRSVALDLRQKEGQAIARQLIAEADVVIESFRPGTLEGWDMSPQGSARAQPRPGDAAHFGLWPDRPLPRPAELWRHWRGHGRPAPPDG